jgi:S-adenosylmethionine-diacylglycerol 3-amino-3-carboxypropyl transferase
MKTVSRILRFEFEARIFVSFFIVALACIISAIFFSRSSPIYVSIFGFIGLEKYSSLMFLFASALLILTSLLRMWSGSLLSSKTVMSFKVQSDSLIISGPYLLVRNPIYFSDLLSLTAFSLFLPLPGILIPILFYIHYMRLIKYEEIAFSNIHPASYEHYLEEVPRLIPTPNSFAGFLKNKPQIILSKDGIRHNALYSLFVPGFIVGFFTESFLTVVMIGIAGVVDWAIIHTKIGLPKHAKKQMSSKVFNGVLYSQCWEDPQIDREAFNIQKDDVVFSITSGGCNLLSFLIDDPKTVIALDLNPHQNYLLELKMAAFRFLSYDSMLRFIGVRECSNRLMKYELIRSVLSKPAKNYWDKNLGLVNRGIIHCGRYEDYMKLMRKCLRLIVSERTTRRFFETQDINKRELLFERKWNNRRWRIFTKVLLSRKTMSMLFDKAFFKYLKTDFSFGEHFSEKVKHALTQLPTKENYFLRYILLGNYDENHLPPYLRREHFETIKSRLNRVRVVTCSCDNYFKQMPENSISKFNFTNVFEWMSEKEFMSLLNETIRVAKDDSVITYRNLLVPRKHPDSLSISIHSEDEFAEQLHKKDLSFIYDGYIVERINKQEITCATELLEYRPTKS